MPKDIVGPSIWSDGELDEKPGFFVRSDVVTYMDAARMIVATKFFENMEYRLQADSGEIYYTQGLFPHSNGNFDIHLIPDGHVYLKVRGEGGGATVYSKVVETLDKADAFEVLQLLRDTEDEGEGRDVNPQGELEDELITRILTLHYTKEKFSVYKKS